MTDYSSKLKKASNYQNLPSSDIDIESGIETKTETKSSYSSFINKIKNVVKISSTNDIIEIENSNSIISKISKCFEVEKSYTNFFVLLFIGLGLIGFSFVFLPMAILAPKKFVSLFSLGCIVTITSFIFYYGTYDFLLMLFKKDRRLITIGFLLSIGIGVYFSFNPTYYIISLICTGIQMVVMVMFILSFIPGGKSGINLIISMITAPFKKIFLRN